MPKFSSNNILFKGHIAVLLYDDEKDKPDVSLGNDNNITDVVIELSNIAGDKRLNLAMSRPSKHQKIFDASYGSIFLTHNYSEISLLLPTGAVYGLGGHPISFNQVVTISDPPKSN